MAVPVGAFANHRDDTLSPPLLAVAQHISPRCAAARPEDVPAERKSRATMLIERYDAKNFWRRHQQWVAGISFGCVPTPLREDQNRSRTLLPKLLPNALGSAGMETDKEHRDP